MEKGLIIFSSQNGSTQKVAEKIRDGLIEGGCIVDLLNISQNCQIQIEEYSFIGVGSPTYMFRPSYAILDLLNTTDNFHGKKVFTFITYGSEIGDGANWLRLKLHQMGTVLIGQFICFGKHLFPGYTSRGYIFSPNGPTDQELCAAKSFGQQIASKLSSNNLSDEVEKNKGTHFVSRFERFVTNRFFIRFIYSHFFSVDKKKCNLCGTCSKVCPTQNIEKYANSQIKWGRKCILCCSCEIHCPQRAISTPISWIIFSPFLVYNIRRTKKCGILYDKSNTKKLKSKI